MNWRSTRSRFGKTCWPGRLLPVQLGALPLQRGEKTWLTHRYYQTTRITTWSLKITFQCLTLPENARAFAGVSTRGRSNHVELCQRWGQQGRSQFSLPQDCELQPWARWRIEHTARGVSDIWVSIVWSFVIFNHTFFFPHLTSHQDFREIPQALALGQKNKGLLPTVSKTDMQPGGSEEDGPHQKVENQKVKESPQQRWVCC